MTAARAGRSGAMDTPAPFLERVLDAQTQLMLVYPEREFVPPAVRVFIDAVTTWAESGWGDPVQARPR